MSKLIKSLKPYRKSLYKKLSQSDKQTIYQGVTNLMGSAIDFDARKITGSGGGILALVTRLFAVYVARPIFVRIATDLAVDVGLIDFERLGLPTGNEEVNSSKLMEEWESSEDISEETFKDLDEDSNITHNTQTNPNS
jgi:hypothetical protein